jgi:pyridinium-3,5-biscarboxylic acid mononucleotide sulfurtransferase
MNQPIEETISGISEVLAAKESRLREIITTYGRVVVAFSAGTDSTYLLALCCETLGPANVLAVTARSATLPDQELEEAHHLTAHLGVRLEVISTFELEDPDYLRNDAHRCFHCQEHRVKRIWHIAQTHAIPYVVYGINADDDRDYRPGLRPIEANGIQTPLRDAGLGKSDIRTLSHQRGLPTHDKPSNACLASRIPYGKPIRVESLNQVAQAEIFLKREIGLRQVRVRHYDNIARLEVEPDEIPRIAEADVRQRIVAHLRRLGFQHITLDLAGFRSGSLNEGLNLL